MRSAWASRARWERSREPTLSTATATAVKTKVAPAGPFRFESLDETAKTISLVRNPKWWGNRPKLDRIVFRVIDAVAQVDALLNGEIDVLDVAADVNKLKRAEAAPGITVHRAAGPDFRSITINGTGEILNDVRIRRALGMAIDRAAIAKLLVGPLGVEGKPLQNHIFMVGQRGYRDNAGILSSPDVNGARKLLDGAGWKLEGNIRKKDLAADTPWNTYTRDGLPPTPIAMPGAGSLVAAVNPAAVDYLYFVSRGDGTHVFTRTLEDHNRAVAKYQLGK